MLYRRAVEKSLDSRDEFQDQNPLSSKKFMALEVNIPGSSRHSSYQKSIDEILLLSFLTFIVGQSPFASKNFLLGSVEELIYFRTDLLACLLSKFSVFHQGGSEPPYKSFAHFQESSFHSEQSENRAEKISTTKDMLMHCLIILPQVIIFFFFSWLSFSRLIIQRSIRIIFNFKFPDQWMFPKACVQSCLNSR